MRGGLLSDVAAANDVLGYDPATGLFTWKVRRNSRGGCVLPGDPAGTAFQGYVQIKTGGVFWRAHRLAWAIMTGELPADGFEIDHINGVRSDNRFANLRLATRYQNNLNMGISRRNVSGVKGVSYDGKSGKWLARLKHEGRVIHLGYHATIDAAASARKAGEAQYHGAFARAA
jgi:hypothetical protein